MVWQIPNSTIITVKIFAGYLHGEAALWCYTWTYCMKCWVLHKLLLSEFRARCSATFWLLETLYLFIYLPPFIVLTSLSYTVSSSPLSTHNSSVLSFFNLSLTFIQSFLPNHQHNSHKLLLATSLSFFHFLPALFFPLKAFVSHSINHMTISFCAPSLALFLPPFLLVVYLHLSI